METAVTTQSRGRLVVLLYEGAIRFLKQAIEDIQLGDASAKGRNIIKAQNIIFELNIVLDMEAGGEIAQSLRSLYNFMHKHLSQANLKCDPAMIREVILMLDDIKNSWQAIVS